MIPVLVALCKASVLWYYTELYLFFSSFYTPYCEPRIKHSWGFVVAGLWPMICYEALLVTIETLATWFRKKDPNDEIKQCIVLYLVYVHVWIFDHLLNISFLVSYNSGIGLMKAKWRGRTLVRPWHNNQTWRNAYLKESEGGLENGVIHEETCIWRIYK